MTSGFFHESILPGSWIHKLIYFRKYFRFRGDILEIWCFLAIPGSRDPEIGWFPGIVTWKSIDFKVTIPGNQFISRYRDPDFRVMIPGHFLRKQLLWIFLEIWAKINKFSQKYSAHFRASLPGNYLISGYCDPEIAMKKT